MDAIGSLVVYALAAGAAVDLWRNGSLFAPLRARAESSPLPGPLRELLGCDYCLTFQAALWLVLLCRLPAATWPAWAACFEAAPAFLAAGRLARLLDGLLPSRLRHDRPASL